MAKRFSSKYRNHVNHHNPVWQAIRSLTIGLFGQRCILFPWLKATQVHHLGYQRLGREIPILDVVPLSRTAHQLISIWPLRTPPLRWMMNWVLQLLAIGWLGGGMGWVLLGVAIATYHSKN